MYTNSSLGFRMEPAYNPCLGCMSMSCAKCACAGESKQWNESMLGPQKKQVKKKTTSTKVEKKKPAPIKDPVMAEPKELILKKTLEPRISTYVHLPQLIFGKASNESFVVIASGNGMRAAGICDGDYLLVDSQLEAQDGDIVMAKVNGEEMCRRIFLESNNRYRVRKEDGETPDIVTSDCIIYGVMIGLSRSFNRAPALDPV